MTPTGIAGGAAAEDGEIVAKVRAHRGLCEGWGECRRWGPSVFHLDEEGLIDIHMLAVPRRLAREAMIGASACPEQAITYDGPRTFPGVGRSEGEAS